MTLGQLNQLTDLHLNCLHQLAVPSVESLQWQATDEEPPHYRVLPSITGRHYVAELRDPTNQE